jgi:arylsulfatase B/arylsulfatase I/J
MMIPPPSTDVLLIVLDDFGWNDVSWRGNDGPGWVQTPNLNAVREKGIELRNYFTNPICSPSRATIMSGRYTIRTGIQHSCYSTGHGTGLPLDEYTIANGFKDAGYDTFALGKWHLGFANLSWTPQGRGFDHFFGHYNAAIEVYNKTASYLPKDDSPLQGLDWHRANASSPPGSTNVHDPTFAHSTPLLVEEFDRLMDARDATAAGRGATAAVLKPLFAYVAFHMVHMGDGNDNSADMGQSASYKAGHLSTCLAPEPTKCLEAPLPYVERFMKSNASLGIDRQTFLGMVALVDEAVGNVTRRWSKRFPSGAGAVNSNGLIVITSDNGSPPDIRGVVSNLPLRGFKHQLWDGGMRVVGLVQGEGAMEKTLLPGGTAVDALWHASDWLPTLLINAGGIADPASHAAKGRLDGVDQWSTLTSSRDQLLPRTSVATWPRQELLHNIDTSSKPTAGFHYAYRRADGMKIIGFGNKTVMLFNATADPSEVHDLYHDSAYASIAKALAARVMEFNAEAVPCWGGTGLFPLPQGFSGDCDEALPTLPCKSPPLHWDASWCPPSSWPPAPAPTPPSPGPPSPSPGLQCTQKVPTEFCRTNDYVCGDDKTDIHKGPEDEAGCAAVCLKLAHCDCFDIEDTTHKGATCKAYSGATTLKAKKGLTAYVKGTGSNI